MSKVLLVYVCIPKLRERIILYKFNTRLEREKEKEKRIVADSGWSCSRIKFQDLLLLVCNKCLFIGDQMEMLFLSVQFLGFRSSPCEKRLV
ncbi:hypothetical protein M6B38_347795 [Iris pallida]|uniref:Uncharacterized protein n=1 Tax=Iris pallida TaxID=29817 RepID=A0AAX6GSE8_IRIPA|nr:hypothetical protein M6B38_347795 [Iris pallida]